MSLCIRSNANLNSISAVISSTADVSEELSVDRVEPGWHVTSSIVDRGHAILQLAQDVRFVQPNLVAVAIVARGAHQRM